MRKTGRALARGDRHGLTQLRLRLALAARPTTLQQGLRLEPANLRLEAALIGTSDVVRCRLQDRERLIDGPAPQLCFRLRAVEEAHRSAGADAQEPSDATGELGDTAVRLTLCLHRPTEVDLPLRGPMRHALLLTELADTLRVGGRGGVVPDHVVVGRQDALDETAGPRMLVEAGADLERALYSRVGCGLVAVEGVHPGEERGTHPGAVLAEQEGEMRVLLRIVDAQALLEVHAGQLEVATHQVCAAEPRACHQHDDQDPYATAS